VLTSLLPSNTVWTPLIANMGYTVGFIIVILGHMQLFTENTITTVVPLFRPFTWQKLGQVGRLWGIVFASNLVGTAIAAAFLLNAHLLNPEVKVALDAIANHVAHMSAMENIVRGIPAGILIASLVWMMPSSSSKLGLIFFMIYLMAYLLYQGQVGIGDYLFSFLLPTALGNILGGTGVFTLLVYGQVNNELN
jgi:formate/nitrite transporter FocA (FNT family)